MPELAQLVTLDLRQRKLFVDGAEFPWLISREGPCFDGLADPDVVRQVTLTFLVRDVEVLPEHPRDDLPRQADHDA